MRINAVLEPLKYNEDRRYSDKSEYNTKRNDNNVKVSFTEILKQVKDINSYKKM